MIENQRVCLVPYETLFDSLIPWKLIVDGAPDEMALLNAHGLIIDLKDIKSIKYLGPVASPEQRFSDSFGIIASIHEEKESLFFRISLNYSHL